MANFAHLLTLLIGDPASWEAITRCHIMKLERERQALRAQERRHLHSRKNARDNRKEKVREFWAQYVLGHEEGSPVPTDGQLIRCLSEASGVYCIASTMGTVYTVCLRTTTCTCAAQTLSCKHILALRVYHLYIRRRQRVWADCEELTVVPAAFLQEHPPQRGHMAAGGTVLAHTRALADKAAAAMAEDDHTHGLSVAIVECEGLRACTESRERADAAIGELIKTLQGLRISVRAQSGPDYTSMLDDVAMNVKCTDRQYAAMNATLGVASLPQQVPARRTCLSAVERHGRHSRRLPADTTLRPHVRPTARPQQVRPMFKGENHMPAGSKRPLESDGEVSANDDDAVISRAESSFESDDDRDADMCHVIPMTSGLEMPQERGTGYGTVTGAICATDDGDLSRCAPPTATLKPSTNAHPKHIPSKKSVLIRGVLN
jgi:hypothetical protein